MKKLSTLLLASGLMFYFSACKKTAVTSPPDFSKITVTDSSCIYSGAVDSTDWTYDDTWTTQELALLNFTDTISVTDSTTGYVQVSAACPNPNHGVFIIGTDVQKQCKLKVAIVNTSMQLLAYNTYHLTGGPIMTGFNFAGSGSFHANENYRMYYAFYNSQGTLFYMGHGDFRIE